MALDFKEDKMSSHFEVNNSLDRIAELIQTRLVDSGWRDQVRLTCRKALAEHTNHRVPTLEELVSLVTPKARSMVPDSVKRELLHELELISVNIDKAATTLPKRMQ